NWPMLKQELVTFYWDRDVKKNTTAALHQLVQDAPALDVNTYLLKYVAISAHLFAEHELSNMQRCRKLLDGLPQYLKDKAIEYCASKHWRISSKETGGEEPKFDELVTYVKGKASAEKKKLVYEQERASEIPIDSSTLPTVAAPTPV